MLKLARSALALAGLVAAAALSIAAQRPPAPLGAAAPSSEFSAGRALEVLGRLLDGVGPHPVGSPAGDIVSSRIISAFDGLGVKARVEEAPVCRSFDDGAAVGCARVVNIVAPILPGEGRPIVLMAHHDSVAAGEGAGDDMHAVAVILETARALRAGKSAASTPVIALITDGEEIGLYGASAWFDGKSENDVAAVINLEARGTSGASFLFETSKGGGFLIDAFQKSARRPATNSLMQTIYETLPNDTDLTMAKRAGVAGANFAFIEGEAHYHTPLDNREKLSAASVQHQGDNVLALTRALIAEPAPRGDTGGRIYIDVLSRYLLSARAEHAPFAGGAALALVGLAAFLAARGGERRWPAVALGLALPVIVIGLSVGASFALHGLSGLVGAPAPGYGEPWPMRVALVAGPLAILFAASAAAGRLLGPAVAGLSVWGWFAAIGLALAVMAPGASVFFLVPTLFAGVALALAFGFGRGGPAVLAAFAAAALFSLLFWGVVPYFLETGLGFDSHFLIAASVALAALPAAPLLIGGSLRFAAGLAVAALAAAIAAGIVPPFTEHRPLQLNIEHVADARTGEAQYRAASAPRPFLPHEIDAVGAFGNELSPGLAGVFGEALAFPMDYGGERAARPEILSVDETAEGRTARLRYVAPEGAESVRLLIPAAAKLTSLVAHGKEFAFKEEAALDGRHLLVCRQDSCDDVLLRFASRAPARVIVAERFYGLPPGGAALARARPVWAVPVQRGDTRTVIDEVSF